MIEIKERVRFIETDMMGVVHHSNYLRWFEQGRVAYLRAAGVEILPLMQEEGIMVPIRDVYCKYINSARFDDEIIIHTTMQEFNRAKMVFGYRIERETDRLLLAEGRTTNAFITMEGKITRLPKKYHEKIAALFALESGGKKR